MLCQVFTAADFSCCLFVALSVFSFVFSEWNAAQSGWDQEIDSAIAEYSTFLSSNSWVAFWVTVHLYYEAPSNQLCCIWLIWAESIQCPPLILAPLVNMNKGGCENKSALFILFIFHSKIHKIPTYHWSKTIESGEKISWWNKCFHYFMLAPNYCNVLFPG